MDISAGAGGLLNSVNLRRPDAHAAVSGQPRRKRCVHRIPARGVRPAPPQHPAAQRRRRRVLHLQSRVETSAKSVTAVSFKENHLFWVIYKYVARISFIYSVVSNYSWHAVIKYLIESTLVNGKVRNNYIFCPSSDSFNCFWDTKIIKFPVYNFKISIIR
jgi:hypothetical protein